MRKLPFKVSARAARLIGAENIANAESAIIELIKNSYDADAETCVVFFEHLYPQEVPIAFSCQDFNYLRLSEQFIKFQDFFLDMLDGGAILKENISPDDKVLILNWLESICKIWIIDDGLGMDESIIENYWMTIGTDNKEKNPISKKFHRIKSGAKGLGRFALDKLGKVSRLYIYPNGVFFNLERNGSSLVWTNTWDNFLEEGKTLDKITAELDYKNIGTRFHEEFLPSFIYSINLNEDRNLVFNNHGVIVCCDYNKENWHYTRQKKLRDSLETLIPAIENENFSILFISNKYSELTGRVSSSINSNYDYKVIAEINNGEILIELQRNEFDTSLIPNDFYQTDEFLNLNCSIEEFKNEKRVIKRKFENFFPNNENLDAFRKVGNFSFSFYFSKIGGIQSKDREKFFYKHYDSTSRKSWNDTFGGVRLFRDNFRVRPYGEVGSAKDWIGLGDRAASSPAGVGNVEGGWRVRPNQISGIINISRIKNPDLADKSSREGLIENESFTNFRLLIKKIIEIFEEDRAKVGLGLRKIYDKKNEDSKNEQKADELADAVLDKVEQQAEIEEKTASKENFKLLASQYKKKKDEIEVLREEQKLLRSMATIGTISSSFSHELRNLYGKLLSRFIPIETVLNEAIGFVSEEVNKTLSKKLSQSSELLRIYKKQDSSLHDWINFSLLGIKKDKRKRKKLNLKKYLQELNDLWKTKFDDRKVKFSVDTVNEDIEIKCFELDLDCIFNNLIINSIDAFMQKKAPSTREIKVSISLDEKDNILVTYSDSGPGLSKDIVNPQSIFDCFSTTKVNPYSGEEEGTGIGMWMVKSTINEYKGETKLLLGRQSGFGIQIKLPKNT